MADDRVKELEKFHLTKEDIVVGQNLHDLEETNMDGKITLMMVGKIVTNRPFNLEAMKRTLRNMWRVKEGVAIRMENMKNGMLWFFDNQLLLLKEVQGDEQLSEVQFTHTPTWIRVYDLPFCRRNI
ncbi:Outer membrane protein assembly factor BamC [Bienertia sinuspersici]